MSLGSANLSRGLVVHRIDIRQLNRLQPLRGLQPSRSLPPDIRLRFFPVNELCVPRLDPGFANAQFVLMPFRGFNRGRIDAQALLKGFHGLHLVFDAHLLERENRDSHDYIIAHVASGALTLHRSEVSDQRSEEERLAFWFAG